MKRYMLPYKITSKSAKVLAKALGVLRLKSTSPVRLKPGDEVVNWGTTVMPNLKYKEAKITNPFQSVYVATNKLSTLNRLRDVEISIPEFTTQKDVAINWAALGSPVMARTILNGSSGKGIVGPLRALDEIPDAPLYVKYIKKSKEYRVHIVGNNFLINQKKRRNGAEVNYHIRSHNNGWVFCKYDTSDHLTVRLVELAHLAVRALGLDFGAVDIIYNSHYDKLYVLEVNTAPGIENEATLEFYTNSIKELREAEHDNT